MTVEERLDQLERRKGANSAVAVLIGHSAINTLASPDASPIAAPEPLYEGWNNDLIAAEQMLRGWEVLWLAQRAATRATLADMTYAAAAALM